MHRAVPLFVLLLSSAACRLAAPPPSPGPTPTSASAECQSRLDDLTAAHNEELAELTRELDEIKRDQEQLERDRDALLEKFDELAESQAEREALLVEKGRLECELEHNKRERARRKSRG